MAKEAKLLIVVGMKDAFTKGMSKVGRFLVGEQGRIGAAFDRTRKQVFNLRNAIVGGLAAVVTKELAQAYATQEAAEVKLQNAMKLTGGFSQEAFKSMKDFASELQNTTTIGDETTLQMLSVAKAMKLTDEQSKDLVTASADLAAATGKDVNESFRQLLKTFGGFAGELGEVFPAMKGLTAEQLKSGAAVRMAREQFDGFAKGEAKSFGGQLKQIGNLWGDVKEKLGAFIATLFDSDLGEFVKTTLVVFNEQLGNATDNLQSGGATAKRFSGIVISAMKGVGYAVAGVLDVLAAVREGFGFVEQSWREVRLHFLQEELDGVNEELQRQADTLKAEMDPALVQHKLALQRQIEEQNKSRDAILKQREAFRNSKTAVQAFDDVLEEVSLRQERVAKVTKKAREEQEKQKTAVEETTTAMEKYRQEQGFTTRRLTNMKTQAAAGTSELDKLKKKAEESVDVWADVNGSVENMILNLERIPGAGEMAATALANHQAAVEGSAQEQTTAWDRFWSAQQKSIDDWSDMMVAAAEQVSGGVANVVGGAVDQVLSGEITTVKELGKALQDMFVDLAREIVVQMIRIAVQKAIIAAIPAAEGAVWEGGFTPIRAFATGGVVSRPTIGIIGEAGQNEAVVPLPNGTDIPVDLRGASAGGGQTVNLNLNIQAMDGPSVLGTLTTPEAQQAITAAVVKANKGNSRFRSEMKRK